MAASRPRAQALRFQPNLLQAGVMLAIALMLSLYLWDFMDSVGVFIEQAMTI